MPHYADGTEAKVGDLVRGRLYNTKHIVVGPLLEITPGVESCNCKVAFVTYDSVLKARVAYDYGETRAFIKVAVGTDADILKAAFDEIQGIETEATRTMDPALRERIARLLASR